MSYWITFIAGGTRASATFERISTDDLDTLMRHVSEDEPIDFEGSVMWLEFPEGKDEEPVGLVSEALTARVAAIPDESIDGIAARWAQDLDPETSGTDVAPQIRGWVEVARRASNEGRPFACRCFQ